MYMLNAFLFSAVFWAAAPQGNAQSGSSCKTPNDETARCKSIYDCDVLYDVVSTTDAQQKQFVKASQCGYYNGVPLVCCGSANNYQNKKNKPHKPSGYYWGSSEGSNESENNSGTGNRNNGGVDRSTCGYQAVDKIVGGETTDLAEFPWMALLFYRKRNGQLVPSCGGTLISSRYVLTAGHCVKGEINDKVGKLAKVRLGEYNLDTDRDCISDYGIQTCNDKPVDIDVEEVIAHDQYNPTDRTSRQNDIALVRLKQAAPTTKFIKPICLPSKSDLSEVDRRVYVAGWGRTETSSKSSIKLKVEVPIADSSFCTRKYRDSRITLTNKQICAGGENGKDSCSGDSGGPLMTTFKGDSAQWYVEGVVSFGPTCGTKGWPAVYTKVPEFLDWIQRNMR